MRVIFHSRSCVALRRGCLALALLTISGTHVAAQPRQASIHQARDLYYAARYEQALTTLDRIDADSESEAATIEQYRAACLLALGRVSEADEAFERLIALVPDMRPDELELAPSIRMRFAAVHARVMGPAEKEQPPPIFIPVVPLLLPHRPPFYTIDDPSVTAPVPIVERVPDPPSVKNADFRGTILVQVDIATDGAVDAVSVEGAVHPIYRANLLAAARNWRYEPAMLGAQPVKFRRALKIEIR